MIVEIKEDTEIKMKKKILRMYTWNVEDLSDIINKPNL
jgi:hypothetical protein